MAGKKKTPVAKKPKREIVRQLTILEMSDGTIDLDPGKMSKVELLGFLMAHVTPEVFIATVKSTIARGPLGKKV